VVDPAIGGLNEEKKCREKSFLTLPRIQIETKDVSTKTLSNLSSQKLKRWCNYERRPAQVFEVAFDGAWDPVPAQMTMHLTIDEI